MCLATETDASSIATKSAGVIVYDPAIEQFLSMRITTDYYMVHHSFTG